MTSLGYNFMIGACLFISSCKPENLGTSIVKRRPTYTAADKKPLLNPKKAELGANDSEASVLGSPLSSSSKNVLGNFKGIQLEDGKSAYVFYTDPEDTNKPVYLVISKISSGQVSTTVYPRKTIGSLLKPKSIFSPIFSPDGRYLLFKYGSTSSPGLYRIFILDLNTGKTRLASTSYLNYYSVGWSPDSNYIVFGRGGNTDPRVYDDGHSYSGELEICVCDWRTGKINIVAKTSSTQGPWSWKMPHTLLYSCLATEDEKFLANPNLQRGVDFLNGKPVAWERLKGKQKRTPVSPNIYEYSIEKQRSEEIIENGRFPMVSPDGSKVAFFSSLDPKQPFPLQGDWTLHPDQVYVTVCSLSNKENRIVLSEHSGYYPEIAWRADGKHLVTLQQTWTPPHFELHIREWDILKKSYRDVGEISANDPDGFRSESDPVFQLLNMSPDGTHIMERVDEYYPLPNFGGVLSQDTLQDVDLDTGSVLKVASVRFSLGVGWSYQ